MFGTEQIWDAEIVRLLPESPVLKIHISNRRNVSQKINELLKLKLDHRKCAQLSK